jgi:cyclopropane fatty-acyl-phospholipid synthase-like methyltransferase
LEAEINDNPFTSIFKILTMFGLFKKKSRFNSGEYWESRYRSGGNSGVGSYDKFAVFKAEIINELIEKHRFSTLIEFGCGDGNQLSLLNKVKYTGLDVSSGAIQLCKEKFAKDEWKSFFLYDTNCFEDKQHLFRMDASMSLDVLFHLVEKDIYDRYLEHLFACASKMVIMYAADMDIEQKTEHEVYRKFTRDISQKFPGWKLQKSIKNKYPAKNYEDQEGSLADFFIYIPA